MAEDKDTLQQNTPHINPDGNTAAEVSCTQNAGENTPLTAAEQLNDGSPRLNEEMEKALPEDKMPESPVKATLKEPNKKKKILKILLYILCIAVIGGVIAYTAVKDFSGEKIDTGLISQMIKGKWYYILVLFGLFFATILLEATKVFIMLYKTTGRFMFKTAFNCAALGKYYDYVTPMGSGGQPFQIYYLAKHNVPGGPAGAIPIGSFFLMQFAFFVCAIVSFICGINNEVIGVSKELVPVGIKVTAYVGAVFYIIIPLFLVVFSFMPKAGHKVIAFGVKILAKMKICKIPEKWIEKGNKAIDNNKTNMAILFKSKTVLIVCSLLSLVYIIAQCSMPYFTLLLFSDAANITPSWSLWFEITKVTFFIYSAITFIPTPGNSGAADGTFYGLFSSLLTVAGTCFTGMMIWRIFSFYSYLVLGIIITIGVSIANRRRMKKLKEGKTIPPLK